MRRDIITITSTLLRKPSKEVDLNNKEHIQRVLQHLEDTLRIPNSEKEEERKRYKGLGLSAVQIGILESIGIVRVGMLRLDLINPKIVDKRNRIKFKGEGCLSIPGINIDTSRYTKITLSNNGKVEEYEGIIAVAVQHEVDHMKGRTIYERRWRKKGRR